MPSLLRCQSGPCSMYVFDNDGKLSWDASHAGWNNCCRGLLSPSLVCQHACMFDSRHYLPCQLSCMPLEIFFAYSHQALIAAASS